jgi:thioredoxin-related protein
MGLCHRVAPTIKYALLALIAFAFTAGHGFASDAASGKITALYFYEPGCPYCARFESGPLKDPAVIKELSTLDWRKVNAFADAPMDYRGASVSQKTLAARYGINFFPTVTFVSPDGKTLSTIRGFFETPDFLEMVKYVTEGHYKNETFEAYIARKAKGG